MAVKKFKPTSPGKRQMTVSAFEEINKSKPEKSLLRTIKKMAGRNSDGRISVRRRVVEASDAIAWWILAGKRWCAGQGSRGGI